MKIYTAREKRYIRERDVAERALEILAEDHEALRQAVAKAMRFLDGHYCEEFDDRVDCAMSVLDKALGESEWRGEMAGWDGESAVPAEEAD